jgi:hypothetical protein
MPTFVVRQASGRHCVRDVVDAIAEFSGTMLQHIGLAADRAAARRPVGVRRGDPPGADGRRLRRSSAQWPLRDRRDGQDLGAAR